MAIVTGRPTPAGSSLHANIKRVDRQAHPLQNVTSRTVRPINYSPLGPSTLHVASPLKNPKVK